MTLEFPPQIEPSSDVAYLPVWVNPRENVQDFFKQSTTRLYFILDKNYVPRREFFSDVCQSFQGLFSTDPPLVRFERQVFSWKITPWKKKCFWITLNDGHPPVFSWELDQVPGRIQRTMLL